MTRTRAGQVSGIRVAGFDWILEWEWMTWGWGESEYEDSDVVFASLSPTSANGGTYFVHHDPESGGWFVYEMGGAGPMVWEREFDADLFNSPMEAMRYIREQNNVEVEAQIRAEEEIEKFFERERMRARAHEDWGMI